MRKTYLKIFSALEYEDEMTLGSRITRSHPHARAFAALRAFRARHRQAVTRQVTIEQAVRRKLKIKRTKVRGRVVFQYELWNRSMASRISTRRL